MQNFGVNYTVLQPGAVSALRHAHSRQDEFIYVLSDTPTLYTDEGATVLQPGMCAGFRSGTGNAHRLVNASDQEAVYLEVGDRNTAPLLAGPEVRHYHQAVALVVAESFGHVSNPYPREYLALAARNPYYRHQTRPLTNAGLCHATNY